MNESKTSIPNNCNSKLPWNKFGCGVSMEETYLKKITEYSVQENILATWKKNAVVSTQTNASIQTNNEAHMDLWNPQNSIFLEQSSKKNRGWLLVLQKWLFKWRPEDSKS